MDKIDEVLTRGVEQILPSRQGLENLLRSKKRIRLYLGIDPTATRLHLGHTIPLRKLQEFAELGHEAILLFGTGTVLVGDPSERDSGRQLITQKEIEENVATWKDQVKNIVDFKKIKIKFNGDWLTKLTLKDIIRIGSKISAIQLFKRDNFTKRIQKGDTVYFHETMYPLLQGYDSVVMDVDLEIGGTDQTFNMLMGRELQKKIRNREKYVLTMKMILGTDGHTMSKSSGNCVWLTDTPQDIYGKLMRLPDELIPDYFEVFTAYTTFEIKKIKTELQKPDINPMTYKKKLAFEITSQLHRKKLADEAQREFEKVVQEKAIPHNARQVELLKSQWKIVDLIMRFSLAASNSEAKRLIRQGGVLLGNRKVTNPQEIIKIEKDTVLKVGKRNFLKIRVI